MGQNSSQEHVLSAASGLPVVLFLSPSSHDNPHFCNLMVGLLECALYWAALEVGSECCILIIVNYCLLGTAGGDYLRNAF